MDLQLGKLSSDIIDEDFSRVFRGFHLLQGLIGRLSVQIKYGFATSPSQWCFFYSIAILTTCILLLIGFTVECESASGSILTDDYFKIGHILNMCLVLKTFVRDIKGNSSAEFYVKLNKIDQDLNFKDGKQCNKKLAKFVKYFSIGLLTYGVTWAILFNIYCMKRFCPFALIVLLPEVASSLDIVILTFTIYYISIRVNYINETLETIKTKTRNEIKSCERLLLDKNSCASDAILWNHLLMGMRSILTVMADFLDLHQYQCPHDNIKAAVVISASLIMTMVIFFALCKAADMLTNKLEKSKKYCVGIRHSFDESISRRNAKRMLLLLDTKYELSIYDIYTLGTGVQVKLLAIIATYTIVLLQFALE
ncbi:uncharacterized protein [Maniola hyperantus]|uniref:uncharacterized protein n=1 Tax=Aphantopus hyperantus TaxID=2795564 RepID=UPI0015692E49|nr:uncharacterized protein LOC117983063 isoform X1 [Maniola hyperantus]